MTKYIKVTTKELQTLVKPLESIESLGEALEFEARQGRKGCDMPELNA